MTGIRRRPYLPSNNMASRRECTSGSSGIKGPQRLPAVRCQSSHPISCTGRSPYNIVMKDRICTYGYFQSHGSHKGSRRGEYKGTTIIVSYVHIISATVGLAKLDMIVSWCWGWLGGRPYEWMTSSIHQTRSMWSMMPRYFWLQGQSCHCYCADHWGCSAKGCEASRGEGGERL